MAGTPTPEAIARIRPMRLKALEQEGLRGDDAVILLVPDEVPFGLVPEHLRKWVPYHESELQGLVARKCPPHVLRGIQLTKKLFGGVVVTNEDTATINIPERGVHYQGHLRHVKGSNDRTVKM